MQHHKIVGLAIAAALVTAGCGEAAQVSVRTTAPEAATTLAACERIPTAVVLHALGLASPTALAGPALVGGSCSWHSSDPVCSLRSLTLGVTSGAGAAGGYSGARGAEALPDDVAVGDSAFFRIDPSVPGAGVLVTRLDVLAGDRWLRLGMLGRVTSDDARRLLGEVASAALA